MVLSPRLSFKGYSIREALFRNKEYIKAILVVISGFNFYTGFDWKKALFSILAGIATLGVKMIIDAIDFYFTEIEVP
jgi:hypothetical protein